MNKYVKTFFTRGLLFMGFGPIIVALVYFIIDKSGGNVDLSATDYLLATISISLLAFLCAGASVFYNIEKWGLVKATSLHFLIYYFCYMFCYLVNNWIKKDFATIAIFTGIFVLVYFVIWISITLSIKKITKKLNTKIKS